MESKFDGHDPEIDEQYKDNPDQTRREFIKKLAYITPVVTTILITRDLSLPDSAHGQATQGHPVCIRQCAVCINQCGPCRREPCKRQSPCRVFQPCRRQCCVQSIQPCRHQAICIRQC